MKARNFSMILYPDSMPEHAIESLLKSDLKIAVSPLHHPEAEEKKPHYHVILCYDGPHEVSSVNEMLTEMYHCPRIQVIESISQSIRYLIHKGWDTKIQYPFESIQSNFDIRKYFADDVFILDILNFIENHNVTSYTMLVKKLYIMRKFDYLEKIAKQSYFFKCLFD